MGAADTNVLVRLLARDNERQVAAAEAFIAEGAWVSTVVLVEALWVLRSVYGRSTSELCGMIEMLVKHRHFVLQDSDAVAAALESFRARPALGFSNCLILELARKAGHLPLGTFDRALGKSDGAEYLSASSVQ